MAVRRDEILSFLDDLLDVGTGTDYGPNGLQVEGPEEVSRVALGVSAGLELFRRAHAAKADLLVVHHGLFFAPVDRISGLLARRLAFLLENRLGLAAYHLPLDRHPVVGNNAVLARRLGLTRLERFGEVRGAPVAVIGDLAASTPVSEICARLSAACGQDARALGLGPDPVGRVAVVSGAGADLVEEAARHGAELLVTGEAAERAHEQCRELGLSLITGGHYATERFGLQALGETLTARLGIEATFIDVPNPL
jgi:dinuclear metal center YbgI/SA1388 family protein